MKKKSNTRVFSVLVALSALVAILCMFADAFDEKVASGEGNIFVIMFGMHSTDHYVVWPLVIGFCLLMVLVLVGFAGFVLGDSGKTFVPFVEAVLGLGLGIFFFFTVDFYISANGWDSKIFYNAHPEIGLGAGTICVIIFSFIAAALALLNVLTDKKGEN